MRKVKLLVGADGYYQEGKPFSMKGRLWKGDIRRRESCKLVLSMMLNCIRQSYTSSVIIM